MKKEITIGILIGMILLLAGGVIAKDYILLCLNEGETVHFSDCNPRMDDRTCDSDSCRFCTYFGSTGAYCPASLSQCNAEGLSCSLLGENASLDMTPPEFNVTFPENGAVYSDRRLDFLGHANELANWEYLELNNDRDRWSRICSKEKVCDQQVYFDEGLNEISVMAEDVVGNAAFLNLSFIVDSKEPRLYRSYPRRGFADGYFGVEYREDNAVRLTLHYGNLSHDLDLEEECELDRSKYDCETYVDLSPFDGQEIEYYFEIEDIAGNVDVSREREVDVDTTFPVVHNEEEFWWQGEAGTRDERYVFFNLNITEKNFDEVYYTYYDSRGRLRDRRICSRLDVEERDDINGICEDKERFSRGEHDITVVVVDEAGNSIGYPISFEVDY